MLERLTLVHVYSCSAFIKQIVQSTIFPPLGEAVDDGCGFVAGETQVDEPADKSS